MFQISGTATVNGTSINPTILDFRTLCIRTLKIVAYTRYTIKNYSCAHLGLFDATSDFSIYKDM